MSFQVLNFTDKKKTILSEGTMLLPKKKVLENKKDPV